MARVIAAISTPSAPAGLGVIRVSGEDAIAVADAVFKPMDEARCLPQLGGYRAAYGHVFDAEEQIGDERVCFVISQVKDLLREAETLLVNNS